MRAVRLAEIISYLFAFCSALYYNLFCQHVKKSESPSLFLIADFSSVFKQPSLLPFHLYQLQFAIKEAGKGF